MFKRHRHDLTNRDISCASPCVTSLGLNGYMQEKLELPVHVTASEMQGVLAYQGNQEPILGNLNPTLGPFFFRPFHRRILLLCGSNSVRRTFVFTSPEYGYPPIPTYWLGPLTV